MSNSPSTVQNPDLRALLLQMKQEIFFTLNCHQIGKIISFDASKQTARVQLMVKRTVYNQEQAINGPLQTTPRIIDYPVLVDVPVFVHTGGTAVITLPVAPGDSCLVLFNDRDIDSWFSTGSNVQPNSQRAHSLSDGFALVGFRNAANPVANYSTTDAAMINSLGGQILVGSKVNIQNQSGSLKTVFDQLIATLKAWVDTHGDTPNPATVTALTAVQTLADSIFK
jgi:hypothetical protein